MNDEQTASLTLYFKRLVLATFSLSPSDIGLSPAEVEELQEPEQDEDGYYDSSGEWWQDAHHYVPSDTDEVLKLIDETLK